MTTYDAGINFGGDAKRNRAHMVRAIELSKLSKSEAGKTAPKVGAVVVRGAEVLGEAYRGELGEGDHAEYTLLERKLTHISLEGATLFTTLEPCTTRHDPKIPCAQRIIQRGITRVFIGVIDPNEHIRGNGWWTLRESNVEVSNFDADLVNEIEILNRDFTLQHRPLENRTTAETHEPLPAGTIGHNGGRIGYTDNGDKVEWLPDDETPGELFPLLLRRNDKSILAMYDELWEKVWYNRHMVRLQKIEAGEIELTEMDKRLLKGNMNRYREIEEKYGGKERLRWNDFEWGLLSGRLSALAWVMGSEWEDSLDT
jgi:pyrimidine deaminase RibD-like protein